LSNGKPYFKFRYHLGEFGPGFTAFEKLLQGWRDTDNLQGLVLTG
jgi:hypothetical protein